MHAQNDFSYLDVNRDYRVAETARPRETTLIVFMCLRSFRIAVSYLKVKSFMREVQCWNLNVESKIRMCNGVKEENNPLACDISPTRLYVRI